MLRSLRRRKILFRLHLTPYRGAVLPVCLAPDACLNVCLPAGRPMAGRAHGMPESIVMGCVIGNLSIPARTALEVMGRVHPVDAVCQ